jgi:hypothetical protein
LAIFAAVSTIFAVIPINMERLSSDEIKDQIRAVNPIAYEYMRSAVAIGLNVRAIRFEDSPRTFKTFINENLIDSRPIL